MSFAEDAIVEMVFIAGSPAELDRAADVLDAAAIDFETKDREFIKAFLGRSAYAGIGFVVLSGQAAFGRADLGRSGVSRGIVAGDPTELATLRELPPA